MLWIVADILEDHKAFREELRSKYSIQRETTYFEARLVMYNEIECKDNALKLLYTGSEWETPCHAQDMPDPSRINTEHIVPQSFFDNKIPMVSDIHHIFATGKDVNSARSNYRFAEFSLNQTKIFYHGFNTTKTVPPDPENYSWRSEKINNDYFFLPISEDRGRVARAILYFFTVYDYPGLTIDRVADVNTLLKWNREYPPTRWDFMRNEKVNLTQGNRNPYVDNYLLAEKAFP